MIEPKINVIMSVYNGERYLRRAVESILGQTFADFEFIIVNDGSTDNSLEIIQSYDDERIKIINMKQNIGLTKSLNKALKLARGEYIARQDADDECHPERLEKQIKFLEEHPEVGLVGIVGLCMDEDGEIIGRFPPITSDKILRKILRFGNPFIHGSVMFRRNCIERCGFYREYLQNSQDYDLWLRISEHYKIANLPEPLYKWRWSREGISFGQTEIQEKTRKIIRILAKERKKYGMDSLQRGDDRLLKELQRVVNKEKINPSSSRKNLAHYHYRLGNAAFYDAQYGRAKENLLKTIKLNPFYWQAWILLVLNLLKLLWKTLRKKI